MSNRAFPVYECYVEGDASHTPVFFTSKREAYRWSNEPDHRGDWSVAHHADACRLLEEKSERIHDLESLLDRAIWLLVQQMPMTSGIVDPEKMDGDQRDAFEWLRYHGGDTAKIHGIPLAVKPDLSAAADEVKRGEK